MPSFKNGNEINYPHPGDSKWPFDPQTLEVTIRLWKGHGFTIPKRSRLQNCQDYMSVSENSGTPKSSILIGFSIINHPFWGTPIFGNTHILLGKLTSKISPDMGWMDRSKPWTQKKNKNQMSFMNFTIMCSRAPETRDFERKDGGGWKMMFMVFRISIGWFLGSKYYFSGMYYHQT